MFNKTGGLWDCVNRRVEEQSKEIKQSVGQESIRTREELKESSAKEKCSLSQ